MSQEKHIIWWKTLSIVERKKILNTSSTKDVINTSEGMIKVLYNEKHNTKIVQDATNWFNSLTGHDQSVLLNTANIDKHETTQNAILHLYNTAQEMKVWFNVIKLL